MNVFENVVFGLKVRKKSLRLLVEVIEEKVIELLKFVKMDGFVKCYLV